MAFGLVCAFGIGLPVVFLSSALTLLKIQNVFNSFGGKDQQGGTIDILSYSKQNNQVMSSIIQQIKHIKT